MSNFQWYRRLRGGTWYQHRQILLQDAYYFWNQSSAGIIVDVERWG